MKYFDELTPEQQSKALDKRIEPGSLFTAFRDDLKALWASRMYIFDDKLECHTLPSSNTQGGSAI